MDALIATYVYQRPTLFWITAFPILRGIGSARRFIRFLVLAILTVRYGPQIVDIAAGLFTRHRWATIGGIVIICLVAYLIIRAWKEPVEELAHDLEEDPEEVAHAK